MTKKLLILSTVFLILTAIACSGDTPTVRHTVTFLNADDSVFHKIQVEDNQTVNPPTEDPIKAEYLLKGWTQSLEGTELFDFATPIKEDMTLFPIFVSAMDPESNLVYIKKEDGTLSVKRYLNVYGGDVFTIPSSYEGMAITSIESEAFIGFYSLVVSIPESITSIGNNAFTNCFAFIVVDEGNAAYKAVDGVLFNKDMTTLISCPMMKSGEYKVPSTVTAIAEYAFYPCTHLSKIFLPKGVSSIGECAFTGCNAEIYLEEGNTVYSWEEGVLFNKDKTTLISCQTSKSGTYAVPDSVTTIADTAFQDCSDLTEIHLPASLTEIGRNVFLRTTSLTSITVDESNNNYASEDGILFNKDKTILIQYPKAKTGTSYKIPDTVNTISELAFFGSEKLESITIPSSVTTIGANAFRFDIALKSITIPESITAIPDGAFSYCHSLTSVKLPSKLVSIGDEAFADCQALTTIDIPESVETISNIAFRFIEGNIEIKVNKPKDSIPGAPWGAENATVIWNQD